MTDAAHAKSVKGPGDAPMLAMSIDVEDWFHTENMKGVIGRDDWDACESRVESNTMRMLEILDEHNARGTFFVLGWVAERQPGLVRAIAASGHEIASHGYGHQLIYTLEPEAFRQDVCRAKALIEDISGQPVRGYRAPCFSITNWAVEILRESGYAYDSSMVPTVAHDRYGRLDGVDTGEPVVSLGEGFTEVAVSCLRLGKRGLPWGGGGYFRFVPYRVWQLGVRTILGAGLPYVFYIHPWEIDPGQPEVRGLSAANGFRQRVNLHRCEARFESLVSAFRWTAISDLIDRWPSRPASGYA
jgi:polysaccharide deacetylase family protein (PEP-CTERM system associated)